MEVKLYVMTHKEKIGSVAHATSNMNEHELDIIENATSRRAKLHEYELREKEYGGYWVYYMSYKGGKDEFGRDYNELISSIFKYRLTIPEGEKLRKIFYRIKEEIRNGNFSLEKSKFVGIKRKDEGESRFKEKRNGIKNLKIVLKLAIFIAVVPALIYLFQTGSNFTSPFKDSADYIVDRFQAAYTPKNIDKYKATVKIVQREAVRAKKYLVVSQKEEREEFLKLYSDRSGIFTDNIEEIEKIVFEDSFKSYAQNMGAIRENFIKVSEKRSYGEIKNRINLYNSKPEQKKLEEIVELGEEYLKRYKGINSFFVSGYVKKAKKMLRDGEKVLVKVEAEDKEYLFFGTKLTVEAMKNENRIAKTIKSGEKERVGELKIDGVFGEKIFLNVSTVNDRGRNDTVVVLEFGTESSVSEVEVDGKKLKLNIMLDYKNFKM